LDLIKLANSNIESIFGHPVTDDNKKGIVVSAEAMSIHERRTERGIEATRFKIEQILEFVSAFILYKTGDNEPTHAGVWLSTQMTEHVFDNVKHMLTSEAKRKYAAQVYNVDLNDIALETALESS
jgi:hypothetical protein